MNHTFSFIYIVDPNGCVTVQGHPCKECANLREQLAEAQRPLLGLKNDLDYVRDLCADRVEMIADHLKHKADTPT